VRNARIIQAWTGNKANPPSRRLPGLNQEIKMSFKEITITTQEGNTLRLGVVRQIRHEKKMVKPFLFQKTGMVIKKVSVQYGIGVGGEGATLKEALADFQKNWSFFCENKDAIVRGEVEGWN
jgi:hypothetical protein